MMELKTPCSASTECGASCCTSGADCGWPALRLRSVGFAPLNVVAGSRPFCGAASGVASFCPASPLFDAAAFCAASLARDAANLAAKSSGTLPKAAAALQRNNHQLSGQAVQV